MRPLEGLLVIAVEQAVAAPLCTARLAEAGARVIKVERRSGDFARGYDRAAKGDSSYFLWINQGKESVVLDYKEPGDHALLMAMIENADVFVQNLAPGALARAGFDSDMLREKFPRLITCDISGYGDGADVADMKAYDLLVQAETGLISISGGPDQLGRIGVSVCDIGAGITAHAGILEALIKRSISGRGLGVKVSLFDVVAEWMTVPLIHSEYGAGAPTRQGLHHPSIAPYGAFETSDGAKTLIAIQNEREWRRFCALVLQAPELESDKRYCSNDLRVQHRGALESAINAAVGHLSAADLQARLQQASIAYGALNSVQDLSAHKALRRRQVENTVQEIVSIPAPPIRLSDTRPNSPVVPILGSATDAVRAEFSKKDI